MSLVLDHLVLTDRDPQETADFFLRSLGIESFTFANARVALRTGEQKINLQTLGQETRSHACIGPGDLCPLTDTPLSEIAARLTAGDVPILEEPVQKSGARGAIMSLHINNPDGNLVENANLA